MDFVSQTSANHHPALRSFAGPLRLDDRSAILRFRQVLEKVNYPGPSVRDVLGKEIGGGHLRADLPLYLRRMAQPTPLNLLIKLFSFSLPVTRAEAQTALDPLTIEEAAHLGLIREDPEHIYPLVSVSAYHGLWLTHDRGEDGIITQPNHVLGLNPPAQSLACLTVRRPVGSALDIGCGSGVQTFLMAGHSERVVGIDTNERALSFAVFNSYLNQVSNVEFRLGSLFDPVVGEQFDLIVSNPPYVISPDCTFQFRDSSLGGDGICRQFVRQAPRHLREGGFATVLVNWGGSKPEDGTLPLEAWVEGQGIDVLLLYNGVEDPLTYAALWNRHAPAAIYSEALERWQSFYAAQGITAISSAAIILRRRTTPVNWRRKENFPNPPTAWCSDQILRYFQTQDWLGQQDAASMLETAFAVGEDHRLHQTMFNRDGEWIIEETRLELNKPLRFQLAIDALTLLLLTGCNGLRTLREVIEDLRPRVKAGLEELEAQSIQVTRRLADLGMLLPVTASQAAIPEEAPRRDAEVLVNA